MEARSDGIWSIYFNTTLLATFGERGYIITWLACHAFLYGSTNPRWGRLVDGLHLPQSVKYPRTRVNSNGLSHQTREVTRDWSGVKAS